MPRTPSPPGQRRRTNADAPNYRTLPAEGVRGAAPKLPPRSPTWLKATRDWWQAIWASPMATVWLESDVPTLLRLADMIERQNRGKASAVLVGEIRQLEDRFGLSPLARRRLQWEIEQATADEEEAPRPTATGRRDRLRAVS